MSVPAAWAISAAAAFAAGDHAGGHDGEMAVGRPGDAAEVTRTLQVTMRETADGEMIFEPGRLHMIQGDTVRLKIVNAGELEHEFVIDALHGIEEHKALMEQFPEMEHDDPNAMRLQPGEKGEIIWTFSKSGDFGFACLIPGHYSLGMHGPLKVSKADL